MKTPTIDLAELAEMMNEIQFSNDGSAPEARAVLRLLVGRIAGAAFPVETTLASDLDELQLRRARFIRLAGYRLPDPLKHLEEKTTPPNWLSSLARKRRFIMQGARK